MSITIMFRTWDQYFDISKIIDKDVKQSWSITPPVHINTLNQSQNANITDNVLYLTIFLNWNIYHIPHEKNKKPIGIFMSHHNLLKVLQMFVKWLCL